MENQYFIGGVGHDCIAKLAPEIPPDFFRWCFVRHPADRLLSAYSSIKVSKNHIAPNIKSMEFSQWLFWLCEDHTRLWLHMQTIPQVDHIYIGESLGVDFIGRFERLNEDWGRVQRILNVPEKKLPHVRKSNHQPWREVYTNSMLKKINKLYENDYKKLGY